MILILSLLLGCGGKDDPQESPPTETTTTTPTTPTTDTDVTVTEVTPTAETGTPTTTTTTTGDTAEPSGPAVQFTGDRPRNLVMISIDTLRRDALSRHGGVGKMPWLDGIASTGVSLDNHTSCSNWTYASMMCSVTGMNSVSSGFIPRLPSSERVAAPDGMGTLAERLGDAGYLSTVVSANSFFGPLWNTTQGFTDGYQDSGFGTDEVIEQLLIEAAELDLQPDQPFYLHAHVKEPHAPYTPPADTYDVSDLDPLPWPLNNNTDHYDLINDEWPQMTPAEQALAHDHLWRRYQGEQVWLDSLLADAVASLESAGWMENTLLVIYTDHGEQFYEHDDQTHAVSLHESENRAIAMLWAENIVASPHTGPTTHADILPTVLDALGLAVPTGLDGEVVGLADPQRTLQLTAVGKRGPEQGVIRGDRKMIYKWEDGSRELFHIDTDPGEQAPITDTTDPDFIALWDLMSAEVTAAEALLPDEIRVAPTP